MSFHAFLQSPEMQSRIFAIIATTLLAVIGRWLKPRPKLGWGISHSFVFTSKTEQGQPFLIRSRPDCRRSGLASPGDPSVEGAERREGETQSSDLSR